MLNATHPDVHVAIDPNGQWVRAATRWRSRCVGCGQSIPTGDVGPLTVGDREGYYSFQHGCGTWNSPDEVEVRVVNLDEDTGEEGTEAAFEVAHRRLRALVAEGVAEARASLRRELEAELRRALARLDAGVPFGEVRTGDECHPGVHGDPEWWDDGTPVLPDDGELLAWGWVPDDSGDYETVCSSELSEGG